MAILTQAVLATALFLGMPTNLPGQPDHDAQAAGEVAEVSSRRMTVGGRDYAWSVIVPEGVEPGGAALLFLHGYGECGDDGGRQLGVGLPPAVFKNPGEWPFVLIVPQKPVHNSEWEDHEQAVLAMLDAAAAEGLYDPQRLAITGLSQGGHGTIAFASRHPDRFRAAAPVCGYADRRFDEDEQRIGETEASADDPTIMAAAERLKTMPVWLFHGGADNVVPPGESRALAAALEAAGGEVRHTEYEGVDHNSWDRAYADSALARWFFEHTR